MQKFLVIQTAFIGDVVLATALLENLHQHYPTAQIDVLVRKGNEALFGGHPFISKVWVWHKKQNKFRNLFKLCLEIRNEKYNDVINLQRYFSSGLLTAFSGGKTKRGFDKNPLSAFFDVVKKHEISPSGKQHEVERNQLLIADLSGEQASRPKLYPTSNDYQAVADLKEAPYICCAPASVWFTKQYPREKWIDFVRQVPSNIRIFFLGAKADESLALYIISQSGNANATSLCGKLSFLESAALMETALMNYVNDSAPMHFSSAVNAPVTAIYCSTVPQFGYGPLSERSNIVQINYPLSCRPCGLHGYKQCPQGHFKCAWDIPHHQLTEILLGK